MVPTVEVRPAAPDDAARLLAWRNDPRTVETSLSGATVAPAEHAAWFKRVLADRDRVLLIGEADGEPIGMCRFDIDGDRAEVSINLDPAHRGMGLARPLLLAALTAVPSRVTRLTAEVRTDNAASVRLFTAAGFQARPDDAGVSTFERSLDSWSIS